MFAKSTTVVVLVSALASSVLGATLAPRRDTPSFYLVSTSDDQMNNLKPLLVQHDGHSASLSTGRLRKFYLEGGHLRLDRANGDEPIYAYIMGAQCGTNGDLDFARGKSSDACAQTFGLSSYNQNSQLGAKLVFNSQGSFYVCVGGKVQYAKDTPLPGCKAVDLWTVPASDN